MSLRIWSTRPMPMNAITQAKATAHTARGWEKNEPDGTGASCAWWACEVTRVFWGESDEILHRQPMDLRGCSRRDLGHVRSEALGRDVAQDRDGRGDVLGRVTRAGQPLGDRGAVVAARGGQRTAGRRREPDHGPARVLRVGLLGDQALLLELAHGAGDRGLRGAVDVGEGGDALRSDLVDEGHDTQSRRLADPAAYGAHEAGGVHDELAALLLEVGRHP